MSSTVASILETNENYSLDRPLYKLDYTPVPSNSLEYALNVLQCLIGIVGVVGNGLVCVVIWKVRREQNYTNSLIVSQSVIDFLTSVILIATVISLSAGALPPDNFALAVLYCIFWHSRVILFSCWAISTFNLTAIAIERYLAVIHPFWYHQMFSRKHAWMLATTAWLIAPIMQTIIGARQSVVERGRCHSSSNPIEQSILGVIVFLWDFFIPLCIMTFSFVRIVVRLHEMKTTPNANSNDYAEIQRKIMKRKNVTKTLVTVFLLFIICWTPEQITFLQFNLGGKLEFGGAWHTIALILATSNSAVNPFVYALRFKQYKEGLKSLCSTLKKYGNYQRIELTQFRTSDNGN
ncbi:adenosine receptor A2b-like [Amphiura filiformis]|uniref:adenosine receptor A2b-like n=1 Tax=Amphiura filiformis TaxID=82378 RepID=UPI003B21A1B5